MITDAYADPCTHQPGVAQTYHCLKATLELQQSNANVPVIKDHRVGNCLFRKVHVLQACCVTCETVQVVRISAQNETRKEGDGGFGELDASKHTKESEISPER